MNKNKIQGRHWQASSVESNESKNYFIGTQSVVIIKTFFPTLIDKIIYLSRSVWIKKNGKREKRRKITLKAIDKNNNDHQVGGCTLLY